MKSKIEIEFEQLAEQYFDMFGTNYPLDITSELTLAEHIERIEKAIKDEKPVKTVNEAGVVY